MSSLEGYLDSLSKPGRLFDQLDDRVVQCRACAHLCQIKPGKRGICKVRHNEDGILMVPWGYVNAIQVDPIEKKPFNHFLPGAEALSFGMVGCNFQCEFCQNWLSSQALNDDSIRFSTDYVRQLTPEQIVAYAVNAKTQAIVSTYNEPLITTEWAIDIFRLAHDNGLKTGYVSNGFATPEALEALHPHLDAYKIDLKSIHPEHYRQMGGRLEPVIETIQHARDLGIWVEVVTLVIPDYNDSNESFWDTARKLVTISKDIPWHVTAFHPDYKMLDRGGTPASTLRRAAEIGEEAGLHYVYAGNLPGRVGSLEDTHCPHCLKPLIQRRGFSVTAYHLTADGKCSHCQNPIAGIWSGDPGSVNTNHWGFPRSIRF
ncbi:MAG: AmmeMemoRadiSam system radical SAM enzyme [Anaerolineaceae bacterium]|nr:AmmeMemoRadiSam system radical SAM enzyme [Anaerolineaceae bacterium]